MGKLRNFLAQFIRFQSQATNKNSPTCTHRILPEKQQHTKLVVSANDHCQSCQERICLVCSEVHVQQHCVVDLKVNQKLGEGTLLDFNQGYLMLLPLQNLKCICGKRLGHESDHAICAACGLASCSSSCHHEWQLQGNCTYHQNYYEKPHEINMRSILFSNIQNIHRARISEWNPANKSALSYISCYAKSGVPHVYLQRGYRNYGIPQPEMVSQMKKVEFGLDYTTHIERICICTCQQCKRRGLHSVGNCQYSCHQMSDLNANQYKGDSQMFFECQCSCQFCRSGIITARHSKLDCLPYCYKGEYKIRSIS